MVKNPPCNAGDAGRFHMLQLNIGMPKLRPSAAKFFFFFLKAFKEQILKINVVKILFHETCFSFQFFTIEYNVSCVFAHMDLNM